MIRFLLIILAVSAVPGCYAKSQPPWLGDESELFAGAATIRPNPIKRVPLVAIVDVEGKVPVKATMIVSDGDRKWEQPWQAGFSKRHRVAVLGMRPDRKHDIRIKLEDESGRVEYSNYLTFQTPKLPDNFPPLEVVRAEPERMEPGLTMFATNVWKSTSSILDYGYIVIVDNEGEVVWFCETVDRIADMRILRNGHILYQHGNYRYAYEIDILGRDHNRWIAKNLTIVPDKRSIAIPIDTTHHDIIELPNGNLATLATELNEIEEYPTSEFDRDAPWVPAHVVCDAVIEFDRETGEIVNRFELRDILDPKRFGYISLGSFWKDKYNDRIGALSRDWSHANALVYLPEEDAMIISFRHLDCIYKLNWATKEIHWILGDPGGWAPEFEPYLLRPENPDFQWFYHQHSPQITPRGTLMLYDNGNYRARPFDRATMAPENRSRILELEIDEDAKTFRTVFEYDGGEEDRFYCPFYCEADWLPKTKNILVTDGGHVELADGTPNDDVPGERQWARVFEITRDSPPQKVFEIRFDSGLGSPLGWSIYRSNRIRSLYGPFRIDAPATDEQIDLFSRERHIKRLD